MNKDLTLQQIISTLRRWKIEAASGYNDGWMVEHYNNNLEKVRKEVEVHKQPRVIT
jgi:hypothetical protein